MRYKDNSKDLALSREVANKVTSALGENFMLLDLPIRSLYNK